MATPRLLRLRSQSASFLRIIAPKTRRNFNFHHLQSLDLSRFYIYSASPSYILISVKRRTYRLFLEIFEKIVVIDTYNQKNDG
jgi:hypothetical protein